MNNSDRLKPTPGPWSAINPAGKHCHKLIVGTAPESHFGVFWIAEVGNGNQANKEESEANAALIAAAPALREFAGLVLHYADVVRPGQHITAGQWEMFVKQARAVIAQAEGPAQ